MISLLWLLGMLILSLFISLGFLGFFRQSFRSPALQRVNYRGINLPTGAGITLAPTWLLVWILVRILIVERPEPGVSSAVSTTSLACGMDGLMILITGMVLVGFLDDMIGSGASKGFRGHLSAFFKGEVSTGIIKAFLGFLFAAAATAGLSVRSGSGPGSYLSWMMNAAIVALFANLFNLFDLRPGRAMKLFYLLLVPGLLASGLRGQFTVGSTSLDPYFLFFVPALFIVPAVTVLLPGDLGERFMLGDAGSNALGAVVGYGIVVGFDTWWRLATLVFALFLNLLSEKYSFSSIIDSNRFLSRLDRLGRKETIPKDGLG